MARRQSGQALVDNRRRVSGNAGAPAVTYRLFKGVSGPSSNTPYSGIWGPGVCFEVTSAVSLKGYSYWVATGGSTAAQTFVLWQITGAATGTLIAAATVTSGTLVAGQWNDVLLVTPVLLTINTPYNAATAYNTTVGFPIVNNQFGSGQPFAGGITNGPLTAYSDTTGTLPVPNDWQHQGDFQVASANPTTQIPNQGSNSANMLVDVIVG